MKSPVGPALLVVLLIAARVSADDAAKEEAARLQGRWTVVAAEQNGKSSGNEDLQRVADEWQWTFKGNRLIWDFSSGKRKNSITLEYTLDPHKKPRTIDLKPLDQAELKTTILAIYSLDRDRLIVCLGPRKGGDRPDELKTSSGSGRALFVLKRMKS